MSSTLPGFLLHFGSGDPSPGPHWLAGMTAVVVVGTALYHATGFRLLRCLLRRLYSRCSWWDYLATYDGLMCKDVQKEILYTSILTLHHLFSGALMAYGFALGSAPVWTLGALVSMMDDAHDMICILLPAWPFGGAGEKRDVKLSVVLLSHHGAAMLITFLAIVNGLAANAHVQRIGAALLLAGGFSNLTLTLSRTRNRRVPLEASQDALIWLCGGSAFFLYFRFVVFPCELVALYSEEYMGLSTGMQNAFLGFAAFMSLFNVAILVDVVSGTAKRVGIALKSLDEAEAAQLSAPIADRVIKLEAEAGAPRPESGAPAATGMVGEYTLPGTSRKALISLPFRLALWLLLMCTLYPIWLCISLLVAVLKKCIYGKPSNILKYGSMGFPLPGMYYPAVMVMRKPFDEAKLRKHYLAMGEEAGIAPEKMRLTFEDEVPRPFPANSGAIEQDHYIETGTNWIREHAAKHLPAPTSGTGMGRGALCWLRVFNGKEGDPTVVNIGLNGNEWDRSSCFNFMKELVHRHQTGEANDVFRIARQRRLPLRPESAAKFDEGWFLAFLARMVVHVTGNAATCFWNALRAPACFGGYGFGPLMPILSFDTNMSALALINFDEADSTALAEGCKKAGIKPFAAMTYAAVNAYQDVVGQKPYAITQQSSLQTRHYGEDGQKERDFIGDWLIGPLQYTPKQYSPGHAMDGYKTLLSDLENVGPSVREAFWCKAYGVFSSGAAIFEGPFFYPGDMRLSEAVFFNNYGIRSMHPDSGFVTWNWGAPFRLGFNTINVNGRTTITCASCLLGLPVVRAIRDRAEETLRMIINGQTPDVHLKYA